MTIELSEYVIDAIADAVVKKMQEPKTEWIPVGKKIPIESEEVLFTYRWHYDDNVYVGVGHITSGINGEYCWNLYEQDLIGGWDILAWMPLPEPYKGVEE